MLCHTSAASAHAAPSQKLARTGSGSTPKSLSGGLTRIDDQMVAMETEVARQRLELSLSQAQAARDAAERKVARQERVLSKLMSELREEKTKAARAHGAGTAVDRLRGEMSGQMSTATARLQGLQESVSRDVASATERLCASAASEHARTDASVVRGSVVGNSARATMRSGSPSATAHTHDVPPPSTPPQRRGGAGAPRASRGGAEAGAPGGGEAEAIARARRAMRVRGKVERSRALCTRVTANAGCWIDQLPANSMANLWVC